MMVRLFSRDAVAKSPCTCGSLPGIYIDEEARQRFKVLDSRECIPIYSNDLNNDLLYVIRYYVADTVNND